MNPEPERPNKLFASRLGPPKTPPAMTFPTVKAKEKSPEAGGLPTFGALRSPGHGSLLGRLKAMRSKELAFVVAGVSTLIMAPLAEHLISTQGQDPTTLQSGFDQKGSGVLPESSVFDEGVSGIAPGGLVGQGQGVITPLQASDPASLIMSPEGDQPPQKPAASPPAQKPSREPSSGWQDALANAAKRSVSTANQHVRLPMPGGKLASKINGLSSMSGSGSSQAVMHALPPLSSKGLVASAPVTASSLSRVAANKDYRGLSAGTGGSNSGFLQNGKVFTGPGGSGSSSSASMPGGVSGTGSGAGAAGSPKLDADGKLAGNSGPQDNRNVTINQKEDLAFLRQKMEMQKQIDLKYAKKMYDQVERKKMLEQMAAQTAQQALLKVIDGVFGMAQKKDGGKNNNSSNPSSGSPSGSPTGGSANPESAGAQDPRFLARMGAYQQFRTEAVKSANEIDAAKGDIGKMTEPENFDTESAAAKDRSEKGLSIGQKAGETYGQTMSDEEKLLRVGNLDQFKKAGTDGVKALQQRHGQNLSLLNQKQQARDTWQQKVDAEKAAKTAYDTASDAEKPTKLAEWQAAIRATAAARAAYGAIGAPSQGSGTQ